jgi:acylphosphatase
MSNNNLSRLHATVKGRVQGVGFRAFVVDKANALGLRGWVRNRWDNTVEVVAEGDREELNRLLSALQQGPRMANVASVQVDWEAATGEFNYFYARPTV